MENFVLVTPAGFQTKVHEFKNGIVIPELPKDAQSEFSALLKHNIWSEMNRKNNILKKCQNLHEMVRTRSF